MLVGAKLDATGQTHLDGGYETQAKITFTGFDMGTALALFGKTGVRAQSSIGGTVTLNSTVTPASVTVNNTNYNYTISGSGAIAGASGLSKSGHSSTARSVCRLTPGM